MPISEARNRLWLPPLGLASCVRCFISRDTTRVPLADADRYSHYPATPLCSVSWWWSGSAAYLEPGAPAAQTSKRRAAPAQVVMAGPHTHPTISWNPGPAHGVMMIMRPDALERLTGIPPKQLLNRTVSAYEHMPADWWPLWDAVLATRDERQATTLIERFLLEQRAGPASSADATTPSPRLSDWLRHLAQRAWLSDRGRSLRQMQRRIHHWTGQSQRDLHVLAKAEAAFLNLVRQHPLPVDWAGAAAGGGYADQSHLGRIARRLTGFSPEALRQRMLTDEAFWLYRLWE